MPSDAVDIPSSPCYFSGNSDAVLRDLYNQYADPTEDQVEESDSDGSDLLFDDAYHAGSPETDRTTPSSPTEPAYPDGGRASTAEVDSPSSQESDPSHYSSEGSK